MSPRHPIVFIGAGPGSADLITVRGAKALAQAEVVLHDALTDAAMRDYAPQAHWVNVGKRGFAVVEGSAARPACNESGQAAINALIVRYGLQGLRVVRLKGGDPSVFGRLEEELQAVWQAGLTAEVVPGVTAAIAAAAATQRPLTRRGAGRSVSLTTAMTRAGDVHATRSADTEVFYMAGKQLPALARQLVAAGWPAETPVQVVSRAGCSDQIQSDHTVASLPQASVLHAGRPTVVCVGIGAQALNAVPNRPGITTIAPDSAGIDLPQATG